MAGFAAAALFYGCASTKKAEIRYSKEGDRCYSDDDCAPDLYDEVVAVICDDGRCAGITSIEPDESGHAPTESLREKLSLSDVGTELTVWGGDGEGTDAIWSVRVSAVVTNKRPWTVTVARTSWVLPELGLEQIDEKNRVELAPGGRTSLDVPLGISLDTLARLRAWKRGGGERTPTELEVALEATDGQPVVLESHSVVPLKVW